MRLEPFLNNRPDVLGLTLDEAALILEKSGYRRIVKKTTPPFSKNLSNDYRILRQNIINEDVMELIIAAEHLPAI